MSEAGPKESRASDASELAGGSTILVAAGVVNHLLRLLGTWYLSGVLGASDFGLYSFAVVTTTTLYALSALGQETGIILFAARFLASREPERLKGALRQSAVLATAGALFFSVALYVAARWTPLWADKPEQASVLRDVAVVVGLFTMISYLAGILRGYRRVVAYGVALQIVLPASIVGGAIIAWWIRPDLTSILYAYDAAHVITLVVVAALAWRLVAPLLRDRRVHARHDTREHLRISIPMGFESLLYRLNQYTDILMLSWLASMHDVGVYKIATALASVGAILNWAVVTTFNPLIAKLHYMGEKERLASILKVATRWMAYLMLPVFMVLVLIPDLLLKIFDEAYLACIPALLLLIPGQFMLVVFAPATRLVPMAGHSMINFLSGLGAFLLDILLCWLLVPRFGLLGAAAATTITLTAWTLARLLTMWILLGANAMSLRFGAILLFSTSAVLLAGWIQPFLPTLGRLGLLSLVLVAFGGCVFLLRTPEDSLVLDGFRERMKKWMGPRPPEALGSPRKAP